MPKIEIVEYDLTSPGRNQSSTDIAYIPGFVDVKNNFSSADYKNALPLNVPTLFTDVSSFEAKCGKRAPKFATTQYYKDVGGVDIGFDDVAVPYNGVMFAANDADPGYVMAKELLAMGLNVLYERVNPDVDSQNPTYKIINVASAPSNWNDIASICEKQVTDFESVVSPKMPELTVVANGGKFESSATYYTRIVQDGMVYYKEDTVDSNDKDDKGYIKSVSTATKTYYVADTTNYYIKTAVVAGTSYEKDKFYQYDASANIKYTKLTSESQPDNWPTNCYSFGDKIAFITKSITIDDASVQVKTYSDDWVQNWATNGLMEINPWIANNGAVFEPNANYRIALSDINIKTMYNALDSIFDIGSDTGIMDKGNYSLKYITTGGYPVYEYSKGALVQKMLAVAAKRGDCVAIIDHTDNIDRDTNIDHNDSLYSKVKEDETWRTNGEFATMFTPWATYNRLTTDKDYQSGQIVDRNETIRMPASFAYLLALAESIKTNANWLAIAGATRGGVLNLSAGGMTTVIPNGAADKMQPRDSVAINPITNINPYGNVIWGNRTLKDNADKGDLTATSFLNIRNLVSDIKKQCYVTARQLTFEQNNDILWINFKALMSPLLDTMLSGYGISGYKMVIDTDKLRELGYPKATLCVKILIYPTEPVEDFYISVVLKDDDTSVVEA